MKKTKFNSDYCGEILLVGFTGNAREIQKYLKKTFGIKQKGKHSLWSKKEKYCLEVAEEVIAHIETYPWTNRIDIELD